MISNPEFTEVVKDLRHCATRLANEGAYWTDPEKDRLAELFYNGAGISEIAVTLQRTEPAVFQQIEKMDLYQRKENPRRQRCFTKEPACLCEDCRLAPMFCPRCTACVTEEEDV